LNLSNLIDLSINQWGIICKINTDSLTHIKIDVGLNRYKIINDFLRFGNYVTFSPTIFEAWLSSLQSVHSERKSIENIRNHLQKILHAFLSQDKTSQKHFDTLNKKNVNKDIGLSMDDKYENMLFIKRSKSKYFSKDNIKTLKVTAKKFLILINDYRGNIQYQLLTLFRESVISKII